MSTKLQKNVRDRDTVEEVRIAINAGQKVKVSLNGSRGRTYKSLLIQEIPTKVVRRYHGGRDIEIGPDLVLELPIPWVLSVMVESHGKSLPAYLEEYPAPGASTRIIYDFNRQYGADMHDDLAIARLIVDLD